jgi:Putative DNA-binding domain
LIFKGKACYKTWHETYEYRFMKRFVLLFLSIWQQRIKYYALAALTGAIVGVLLLAPSYAYITSRLDEQSPPISSSEYLTQQLTNVLNGNFFDSHSGLILFYAEIGALIGILSLLFYKWVHKKFFLLDQLKSELDKDLTLIISQGEGFNLEFKSSFRWDLVESRTNRALEMVAIKTITGFLNSYKGGTLLIGVADNGDILGLEQDFQTLKKKDQDGFEQAIMTAISANIGADVCTFVHVLFHVLDGKEVCRLIVSPSTRPVFIDQGNAPKFYVRTGAVTRDLNIQEAVSYIFERWKNLNHHKLSQ